MNDLLKILKNLSVQTGSLACFGCGHEQSCSTKGCAIIRKAIDTLCAFEWIDADLELPTDDSFVLAIVNGAHGNITFDNAVELAFYDPDSRWVLEAFPLWENPNVLWWMPIPDIPMRKDNMMPDDFCSQFEPKES